MAILAQLSNRFWSSLRVSTLRLDLLIENTSSLVMCIHWLMIWSLSRDPRGKAEVEASNWFPHSDLFFFNDETDLNLDWILIAALFCNRFSSLFALCSLAAFANPAGVWDEEVEELPPKLICLALVPLPSKLKSILCRKDWSEWRVERDCDGLFGWSRLVELVCGDKHFDHCESFQLLLDHPPSTSLSLHSSMYYPTLAFQSQDIKS